MEIRHLNSNDDLSKISHIYEESWKYAYKNIIPQTFLDSIPCGNWISHLKDPEMNILVMLDNGKFIGVSTYAVPDSLTFRILAKFCIHISSSGIYG